MGRGAANYIQHPAVADFGVNLGKYGLKAAQKQAKIGDYLSKKNAILRWFNSDKELIYLSTVS